ncbi:MAG: prolyl oligopeptidase family serine peptidase, partial [Spirochaetes bacterium]|nr:prolyl oligopeptidase family serine peptidase [Spirochaetota bacterium]
FPESTLYFVRKRSTTIAANMLKDIENEYTNQDYSAFSAIEHLKYINIPIILHHGTEDDSVPYQWSLDLMAAMKKAGIKYTFHSYQDDHNFAKGYFYTVLARDVAFFKKFINTSE